MDPLALDSYSIIIEWAEYESYDPPYLDGAVGPNKPIYPNYLHKCIGNLSFTSV